MNENFSKLIKELTIQDEKEKMLCEVDRWKRKVKDLVNEIENELKTHCVEIQLGESDYLRRNIPDENGLIKGVFLRITNAKLPLDKLPSFYLSIGVSSNSPTAKKDIFIYKIGVCSIKSLKVLIDPE